jgi:hypothetical protein
MVIQNIFLEMDGVTAHAVPGKNSLSEEFAERLINRYRKVVGCRPPISPTFFFCGITLHL